MTHPQDDRAALIETIRLASMHALSFEHDAAIADALLAAGWTRGGEAAALREAEAILRDWEGQARERDVRDPVRGQILHEAAVIRAALTRSPAPETRGGEAAALEADEAAQEEALCSCGAGHGSLEGHMSWCDYDAAPARPSAPETQ